MEQKHVRNNLMDEVVDLLEHHPEEDVELLHHVIQSLKRKRLTNNPSYITSLLNFERRFNEDGTYEMTMPIDPITHNSLHIVHGGVTATLLDTVMGSLANHVLPEGKGAVTSEMKVNYLAPGVGSYVRSEAEVIHQGKRVIVVEGKAYTDDGRLIAISSGSFFVVDQ